MRITRRTWLSAAGLSAAGLAGAAALPAAAADGATIAATGATPAFRAVLVALAEFAAADLAAHGFPGMTVAVRAADGQTATLALGRADLCARTPVRADQLFQIGSISKSFVAMALFVLAGQQHLDLDAPAVAVVPELPLADRSITIAQLLSHSAGLPDDTPPFPVVPGGKLWSATPPGSHFSYSNAGYDMLAFVVERASGMRYDHALTTLVLGPLGLTNARAVIRTADRDRFAQGYVPFHDDVAWFPDAALTPGVWVEVDRAAGSIAATSPDMLRYIAFLGSLAQGHGAPLFSDALARRFATPVIATSDFGPGAHYANGLATVDVDGKPAFHHTGGMLTFSSAVYVDRASGAGVFASVNIGETGYRPRQVASHGVRLLRAMAASAPLPPPQAIVAVAVVEDAGGYVGRYVGSEGRTIVVTAAPDGLRVVIDGAPGRLKAAGDGSLVSDAADRSLAFTGGKARRDGLWFGDVRYARDGAAAQPKADAALAALAGTYKSDDPWAGSARVVVRGDTLAIDGGGPLHRAADGSWRFADPLSTERLWFEQPVAGRPRVLNVSGNRLLRFDG